MESPIDPAELRAEAFRRRLNDYSSTAEDSVRTARRVEFQRAVRVLTYEYENAKRSYQEHGEAAFTDVKKGVVSLYRSTKFPDVKVRANRQLKGLQRISAGATALVDLLDSLQAHVQSMRKSFAGLVQTGVRHLVSDVHFAFEPRLVGTAAADEAENRIATKIPPAAYSSLSMGKGQHCVCAGPCARHQGATFTWCALDASTPCAQALRSNLALDLTLRDHFLYASEGGGSRDAELTTFEDDGTGTGRGVSAEFMWDYCVPPSSTAGGGAPHNGGTFDRAPGQPPIGSSPQSAMWRTAHGCQCAWNRAVVEKYNPAARPDVFVPDMAAVTATPPAAEAANSAGLNAVATGQSATATPSATATGLIAIATEAQGGVAAAAGPNTPAAGLSATGAGPNKPAVDPTGASGFVGIDGSARVGRSKKSAFGLFGGRSKPKKSAKGPAGVAGSTQKGAAEGVLGAGKQKDDSLQEGDAASARREGPRVLDLSRVPMRDRVAVQLMAPPEWNLPSEQKIAGFSPDKLCASMKEVGASWAVCPVDPLTCPASHRNFTWDFCNDANASLQLR